MAKTTTVYFDKIIDNYKNSIIFRTVAPKRNSFLVKSFEDGIVTVEPMDSCTITDIADIIEGCFEDDSNFGDKIIEAFNIDKNTSVIGINTKFHGLTIKVTRENTSAGKKLEEREDEAQKEFENQQHEITRLMDNSYMHSPEYRAERARQRAMIRLQRRFYGQ